MKEVAAIIRMNRINATKEALSKAGVSSFTARECLGRGRGLVDLNLLKGAEKGYEEAVVQLGQSHRLGPKWWRWPSRRSLRSTVRENRAMERFLSCR